MRSAGQGHAGPRRHHRQVHGQPGPGTVSGNRAQAARTGTTGLKSKWRPKLFFYLPKFNKNNTNEL